MVLVPGCSYCSRCFEEVESRLFGCSRHLMGIISLYVSIPAVMYGSGVLGPMNINEEVAGQLKFPGLVCAQGSMALPRGLRGQGRCIGEGMLTCMVLMSDEVGGEVSGE